MSARTKKPKPAAVVPRTPKPKPYAATELDALTREALGDVLLRLHATPGLCARLGLTGRAYVLFGRTDGSGVQANNFEPPPMPEAHELPTLDVQPAPPWWRRFVRRSA